MKTEIKDVTSVKKEISVTVEADELKVLYSQSAAAIAKKVTVPGFRKGIAPPEVVKVHYKEEIKGEVLRKVVPKGIDQAVAEHRLQTLGDPDVQFDDYDTMKVDGSSSLKFQVYIEVMPEIATLDYKGIEVARRVRPMKDGEVEEIIEERRKQFASLVPVEGRASEDGDTLIIDIVGTFEDQTQEPVSANDLEITIGDPQIEKSFTENLRGLKSEESKTFTVSYPEDFGSQALAGKTVTYSATVKSVGRKEVPELDDEWVKSLDEGFETVAELRKKISKDIEVMSVADADAKVRTDVMAKLIEKNIFDVPSLFVKNQANNLLNRFAQDLQGRGIDPSQVGKDFLQMIYQQMQGQAESDVRGALILQKVAELEKVEVSDAEVADEILRLSEYYRVSPDEIRAAIVRDGGEEEIKNNLKTRKTIEAVVSHAKISDEPWVDEAEDAAMAASAEAETEEKPVKKAKTASKPAGGKKAKSKESGDD